MKLKLFFCALLAAFCIGAAAQKPITVQGSVGKLSTVIVKPQIKEGEKVPMVIICHGFTGNKNEFLLRMISEGLKANGIASVRFDFNGHGESEGKFENMTVCNEIEDVLSIYNYVSGLDYVDASRIGIVGHSQGGLVASLISARLGKDRIKCEALMAPAANIPICVKKGSMLGIKFDPENPPKSVEIWGHKVGRAYFNCAKGIDVYAEAGTYEGSACVIHGTADTAVPFEYGKGYCDVIKDCKLYELEGYDHGYSQGRKVAFDCAVDFLTSKLLGGRELIVLNSKDYLHCDDSILVFNPATAKKDIPTVFLLHGYKGNFRNWSKQMDLQALANETGFRIICPDGFYGSWYFDDADKGKMQWRSFFWNECWPYLKERYCLVPERTFITGLSMGGHGAMNIFLDHPELFRGAGSMSGVLDLTYSGSKPAIAEVLGMPDVYNDTVKAQSACNRLGRIKETCSPEEISKKILVVTVGYYDTPFVEAGEVFRSKCMEYDIPHVFMTSQGRHRWNYWTWVVKYHLSWFAEKL